MIKKKIPLDKILEYIDKKVTYGYQSNISIDNICDANHVTETTLDWINPAKRNKQELAERSVAKVLLVDNKVEYTKEIQLQKKTLIVVDNPKLVLIQVIRHFFKESITYGIHETAYIHPEAIIGENVYIGPLCSIGKCKIGNNTIINPNVVIYNDVVIGNNCIIQAGAILGTDGLGCSRNADGQLTKFPHIGTLIIGNDVEIGANSQIAKGALSDTIIENGCKINGLCFIAHNCHLEENVWITGDTMLCGSTFVGKNTTIYSNVIVREQVKIGKGSIIGMGSVVTKNVPDGETWFGSPAHLHTKK